MYACVIAVNSLWRDLNHKGITRSAVRKVVLKGPENTSL